MAKPKIRFKGYQDDWEQRKLSNVVDSVDTGKSKFDKEGSSGEYPILGSTSVIGYDDEYDYEGDFILTARVGANAGSLYRHAGKVKISDNTVFIQASQNIEFLYQLLTRFDIKKLSFGTGQPLVKASELKSLELMMPTNMKEQMRIGAYFNHLDHLITLHQRKCEEVKKLKKFMLQKIFPQNGSLVPEIRFDGFTDDWEQRKLGDVFRERIERATGDEELLSVTIANGVIRQADSEKRNIASEDKKNYKVVHQWDVPYNSMRMWQGAVGNSEYCGIVSPAYTVLIPTQEANGKFFMELFKKENSLKIFQRWSQGLTSDTWNLKYPVLSTIEFYIPKIDEQNKIATYFTTLDHLITLHQQKCDDLKKLKKYMLQNMFV